MDLGEATALIIHFIQIFTEFGCFTTIIRNILVHFYMIYKISFGKCAPFVYYILLKLKA